MFLLLGVLAAMLVVASPVGYTAGYVVNSLADTIDNDSACTLREAIQEANNGADTDCAGSPSSADDTITFSVSGTITLTTTLPNIVSASTAGKLTIDGTGQSVTISGDNSVRVFFVNSGGDLTLKKLTVSNGNSAFGGGILSDGGMVSITNSTFSDNSADSGGGIANDGGTLSITDSTFSGNSATSGFGGGIYNFSSGPVSITDSTFSGNSAPSGFGGGIVNFGSGTLSITDSTFSGNSAPSGFGGGIYNVSSGTLTVTDSTFS
ncbi:MAG: CSLREA domain-containing protein, partial [Caldilineales bacterium]|nr:CSLREA domain-containing protein [Caldilineales bacterium]